MPIPCPTLPTGGGFYWWRARPEDDWRMVQIVDCGNGYLNAYDVQRQSFGGRSLKYWPQHFAVGEWLKVEPPAA